MSFAIAVVSKLEDGFRGPGDFAGNENLGAF
jgi:hypothetical protein